MFAGMIVVIGCVAVAVLISVHATAADMPPKAKLLCDLWRMVEEEKPPRSRPGRIVVRAC